MNWLDSLRQAAGAQSVQKADAVPSEPKAAPAEIFEHHFQIRGPSGNDPGEICPIFFTFEVGKITLVTEKGVALTDPIDCPPTLNPRSKAAEIALGRWEGNGRFNRTLEYPLRSVV